MTRYFEIYVAGSSGFSSFVKTDIPLPSKFEDTILEMAVKANIIEGGDAKEIVNGGGYVQEVPLSDVDDFNLYSPLPVILFDHKELNVVYAAALIALADGDTFDDMTPEHGEVKLRSVRERLEKYFGKN